MNLLVKTKKLPQIRLFLEVLFYAIYKSERDRFCQFEYLPVLVHYLIFESRSLLSQDLRINRQSNIVQQLRERCHQILLFAQRMRPNLEVCPVFLLSVLVNFGRRVCLRLNKYKIHIL